MELNSNIKSAISEREQEINEKKKRTKLQDKHR